MTPTRDTLPHPTVLPASLHNLARLAFLLERLEQPGASPNPAQYRQVVHGITSELRLRAEQADTLEAFHDLLASFPATAVLYENLRYDSAGLCLSPLERSVRTEQAAAQWLAAIAAGKTGPTSH